MKIVYLNAWWGKIYEPISEFIKQHAVDTDVFCFQEAHDPFLSLSRELLPDFNEVSAGKRLSDVNDFYQSTFVRKSFEIISSDTLFDGQEDIGLAVSVDIKLPKTDLHILNFHGSSRPIEKLDTPARLRASQELMDFYKGKPGPKVIGGDFNILPENQSIRMFPGQGYRDLIQDYDIPTTRNRLIWDKYPDTPMYYSDYVFVSDDVRVKTFSVPPDEVSDHLAMIMEVEV